MANGSEGVLNGSESALTGFLLARITEDEEAGREGAGPPEYPWHGATAAEECAGMADAEGCSSAGVEFIRHFLPARMLAECAAKRRIVARYREHPQPNTYLDLLDLALPYANHPNHSEDWEAGR